MSSTDDELKTCRIASLTLVNAMIFQQVLAERDARVTPLEPTISGPHVAERLVRAWTIILDQIDYIPIFSLARDVVHQLMGTAGFDEALRHLGIAARRITSRRAALRHDLMGRIYHRLLADAKFFGAYYTTIPARTSVEIGAGA